MDILSIVILAFVILEALNVTLLYFAPGSTRGNAMGAFKAFEKSKEDSEVFALVQYLVNWVAGTKLIFIGLLLVIVAVGSDITKVFAAIALIISIGTFYWRLYPAIKKLDDAGQISPKGYASTLAKMIGAFIVVFVVALIIFAVRNYA